MTLWAVCIKSCSWSLYFRVLWIQIRSKQLINSWYAFALWQLLMFFLLSNIRIGIIHVMPIKYDMMWNFLLALSVPSPSNSCTMFNFCQFVSRRRRFTWAVQRWQDEGWTLLRIRKTRHLAADCQTSHESLSFVVSGDNLHSEAW